MVPKFGSLVRRMERDSAAVIVMQPPIFRHSAASGQRNPVLVRQTKACVEKPTVLRFAHLGRSEASKRFVQSAPENLTDAASGVSFLSEVCYIYCPKWYSNLPRLSKPRSPAVCKLNHRQLQSRHLILP